MIFIFLYIINNLIITIIDFIAIIIIAIIIIAINIIIIIIQGRPVSPPVKFLWASNDLFLIQKNCLKILFLSRILVS